MLKEIKGFRGFYLTMKCHTSWFFTAMECHISWLVQGEISCFRYIAYKVKPCKGSNERFICIKHEGMMNMEIRDIQNHRFGRLIALYPTSARDAKQSVYWHCRCDCGNEVDLTEDNLVHGSYKSCGCLGKELKKNIHKQLHIIDGTCLEWIENRKYRSDNTSGFRGVSKNKRGHYRVNIGFKGKKYYIGTFSDYEDAVKARLEAEALIHDGFVRAYRLWEEQNKRNPDREQKDFIFEVTRENGEFKINTNMQPGLLQNNVASTTIQNIKLKD